MRGVNHYVAVVKVLGRTLGGTNVESSEWQFPIDICFHCLITFPAGTSTMSTPPNCDAPVDSSANIESPCNPGQDDPMDCRACKELFANAQECQP